MESTNVQQQYHEIEYTETHPELKQTENIDESQDPQTTERNMGLMTASDGTPVPAQFKGGLKSAAIDKNYEGIA